MNKIKKNLAHPINLTKILVQDKKISQKVPLRGIKGGCRLFSGLPRRSCLTARNDDVPFCKGIAGQARNDGVF